MCERAGLSSCRIHGEPVVPSAVVLQGVRWIAVRNLPSWEGKEELGAALEQEIRRWVRADSLPERLIAAQRIDVLREELQNRRVTRC